MSLFESTGIPHPAFFLPANRSCGVYPSGLLSEFGALPFQLAGVTPREPQIPAPPKILLPPPLSSKKILGPRGNSKPLLPVKTTFAKGPQCLTIVPTLPREQTRTSASKFAWFCRTAIYGPANFPFSRNCLSHPQGQGNWRAYSGFNKRYRFSTWSLGAHSASNQKCFQSR